MPIQNNTSLIKSRYLILYLTKEFKIAYESCGYYDPRPRIIISLFFFHLEIIFPFVNSNWEDECDPPCYGIAYHNQMFWIYYGGEGNDYGGNKWIAIESPFTLVIVRKSVLGIGDNWIHETKKTGQMDFFDDTKWKDLLYKETHHIAHVLDDGYVQHRIATLSVRELEFRYKWIQYIGWPNFMRKITRVLNIEFNGEVGGGVNSYKGGVLAASVPMLKNETNLDCLSRYLKQLK
jgi:hypothetical protein